MGDKLTKGENRIAYFAKGFGLYYLPSFVNNIVYGIDPAKFSENEKEEIDRRASYYVRLPEGSQISREGSITVGEFKYPFHQKKKHSTYFFDLYPYVRKYPSSYRFNYLSGDVDWNLPEPTFVKSRPVVDGCSNSVVCRLNSVRHFRFVDDPFSFRSKDDIVVSRNYVVQPWRIALMERWFGTPGTDFGQINQEGGKQEWIRPFLTVEEQLRHKFIMCVRGNDVATNLKWVMSSNSVAVMPKPDVESWYMEGLLIPDYHYIEVKPDYSDLMDKLEWYKSNPEAAEEIIRNAHEWVERFRNPRIEKATMTEVVKRYFNCTTKREYKV